MVLFINEHSLTGQFADANAFEAAIRTVTTILGEVLQLESGRTVWFSQTGFMREAIRQQQFCRSLRLLPDRSIRVMFKQLVMDRLGAANWNCIMNRQHSGDDIFEWLTDLVTEFSPAE